MLDRKFDWRTDRVARQPTKKSEPARTLTEAYDYALWRADQTGKRQHLRKHSHHGWWLVLTTDESIGGMRLA